MFPEADCYRGYSFDLLEETLGEERFTELMHWMRGQTMALCDGQRYDHDTKQYYKTGVAHGPVVYSHDLFRFLGGGPILD